MKFPAFPSLPLLCLQTACDTTTHEVCKGKNTVIDFWTTRCTRCPAALDKLNDKAAQHATINVISVCCDKCDGAREILERDNELKWNNIHHYYMCEADKERAKAIFGFQSVPFYVVLNDRGEIVQMGHTIDWTTVPGCSNVHQLENQHANLRGPATMAETAPREEQSLVIDDLDF